MPLMIIYDQDKNEVNLVRDYMSKIEEKDWTFQIYQVKTIQELIVRANGLDDVSIYCVDYEDKSGSSTVNLFKERHPDSAIIIIAGMGISPALYLRPSVGATGIFLRPMSKKQVSEMLSEVIETIKIKQRNQILKNELFVFSTREGVIRIPYAQILFFEAKNKKIAVCTGRTETEFYSSLDGLSAQIPNYFIRCHKGFIVNKYFINQADFRQNELNLAGGFRVPISRSFKSTVKEAIG